MKKHLRWMVIGLVLSMPFFCASRAAAQIDPWEFEVYPIRDRVARESIELETDNAVVTNGHSQGDNGTSAGTFRSQGMWYNGNELTYGLTDRIEAAAYVDFCPTERPWLLVGG